MSQDRDQEERFVLPPGDYLATCIGGDNATTSGDNDQVALSYRIKEGEHAGKSITFFGSLVSDAAIKFTLNQLKGAGFEGHDITDFSSVIGKDATLVVINEEYDGKNRAKVKFINSAGGAFYTPADKSRKAALKARMKAKLLAFNAGTAPSGATTSKTPSKMEDDDDDIPFG